MRAAASVRALIPLVLLLATGCAHMPVEPPIHVTAVLLPDAFQTLPKPPPQLTSEEHASPWGQEYALGCQFALEGDYYRAEELADKIAYVPQKPFVFSGTIKDNILYGCQQTVTNESLLEAAKNACILDEIQESLGGFEGSVSENGNNLSGGQRQRLALARVMLQSPQLIIFDEATFPFKIFPIFFCSVSVFMCFIFQSFSSL